jgi:DNA replication and repair protein RecF
LHLSEFSSHGFRNLSSDPVSFGAGVTLVTGENAQGKTNLIEAVSLLCGQRSFRGATSADMASDRDRFSIAGTIERATGPERLRVSWSRQSGREFARGEKPSGFREISALAPAVFLAPEHRELISGSPAVRRRFLDRLALGLKPAAGDDFARYATALRERNALLSRARLTRRMGSPGELEAWTEELALAGSAVRRQRRAALEAWERAFAELARHAFRDGGKIRVEYASGGDSSEGLRESFERLLPVERRRGHSLAGPHRDDLTWSRGGRPLAGQASTGEITRIVALAKLAEWSAVAKVAEEPPLLAVDDFDAGLSEGWADEFFNALPGDAAVILTTATSPDRWARRAGAVLEVRAGVVSARRVLRAVEATGAR